METENFRDQRQINWRHIYIILTGDILFGDLHNTILTGDTLIGDLHNIILIGDINSLQLSFEWRHTHFYCL